MSNQTIRMKATLKGWRVTTIEHTRRSDHVESIETYDDFKEALKVALHKQRLKYSEIRIKN